MKRSLPLAIVLILGALGVAFAQRQVSGVVTSAADGTTLPGVTVVVGEFPNLGTITDIEGRYSITLPEGGRTLTFSFVGMTTQSVDVGAASVVNVRLEMSEQALDEVVIVAFGTQKKATVTGAVASIETKDLLQSPQANISNALVGRMPGLLTKQTSGEPGHDQAEIRIRGASTFAGSLAPLIMIDGVESENYNNLDPNTIENITILKDASATAVYGVRGANGVVLITTKRGTVGAPKVSYTYNIAATSFIELRENMNSYNHAKTFNEALRYDSYMTGGYNPRYSEYDLDMFKNNYDPVFYPDVNWHKELLRPYNLQSQHNLNISGGTEKVKYFASVGYFNQGGLLNNTTILDDMYDAQIRFKRYNFRSNLDFSVTKALTVLVDLSTTNEDRRGKGEGTSIPSFILALNSASPSGTPGVIDGKLANINVPNILNPYSNMYNYGYSNEYRNYLKGRIKATLSLDALTKGLSIHGAISHQSFNSQRNSVSKLLNVHLAVPGPDGPILVPQQVDQPFSTSQSFGKNRFVYAETGINYAREFGPHYVTGLVLYNQSKRFDPNLEYLIPSGYQGLVGRVTYNYKEKYLAEINAGYNGTENFAPGKRFGFFPAYSLGWVLSEESFFPENNLVSFVKVRASYGEVGNDKIGGERFLYRPSAYEYAGGYYFGEVASEYNYYVGARESKIGNPDLTWERALKKDLGIELAMFKSKLRVNVDFFEESRNNILTNISTLPSLVGADLPAYNMGKMKNRGFDGEITFNDRIGRVNYWVKGIYTFARNEIIFQDEVPYEWPYQNRTGQILGQYFGYLVEGFYNTWEEVNDAAYPLNTVVSRPQPGDVKYKDVNGDGMINGMDYVPIGFSNFPGRIFGISFGGEYRGFDVSVLFQGASDVSYQYPSGPGIRVVSAERAIAQHLERSWTHERYEEGLPIDFPRFGTGTFNYSSSNLWTVDASYLRLKNVEIGYRFSNSLFKRLRIQSGRIFANGNNLMTWSGLMRGFDPEQGSSTGNQEPYPMTRTYNLGVNLNF